MRTYPYLSTERKIEFLNYIIEIEIGTCEAAGNLDIECNDCPFNNNKCCEDDILRENRIIEAKKLLATFFREIKEI